MFQLVAHIDLERTDTGLPIISISFIPFHLSVPSVDLGSSCWHRNFPTDERADIESNFLEHLEPPFYLRRAKRMHHRVATGLERVLSLFAQEHFLSPVGVI